jgi:hypothetical protein
MPKVDEYVPVMMTPRTAQYAAAAEVGDTPRHTAQTAAHVPQASDAAHSQLGVFLVAYDDLYAALPPGRKLVVLDRYSLQVWAPEVLHVQARFASRMHVQAQKTFDLRTLKRVDEPQSQHVRLYFPKGVLQVRAVDESSPEVLLGRYFRQFYPHQDQIEAHRRLLLGKFFDRGEPRDLETWMKEYLVRSDQVSWTELELMLRDAVIVRREKFLQRVAQRDYTLHANGDSIRLGRSDEARALRVAADAALAAYSRAEGSLRNTVWSEFSTMDALPWEGGSLFDGLISARMVLGRMPKLMADERAAAAFG